MSQPETAEFCDKKLTVFYDGACPLCEREIGFYRRRKGAGDVHWVDVSAAGGDEVAPGLSRSQAMARFHVRDESGRLVDGGAAFAMLWRALPGFHLFGRICQVPPLPWILNWSYDRFLKVRPRLQAWTRARLSGRG